MNIVFLFLLHTFSVLNKLIQNLGRCPRLDCENTMFLYEFSISYELDSYKYFICNKENNCYKEVK